MLGRLVQIPPPSTLLEQLKEKLGVISSTNETSIVLEKLSFKIELDSVTLIQRVK